MTGPSGALARTWLRRNVVATVLLVCLVALACAATWGAVAAARRASTSLDRFLEFNRPPVVQVYGESLDLDAVEALPQVVGSGQGAYGLLTVESAQAGPFASGTVNPFITSRVAGERTFRPLVLAGREPDPSAPDEVAIDEQAAGLLRVGVGDDLRVQFFLPEQIDELYESGGDLPTPRGESTSVTVTGIVRHPFDLNPVAEGVDAISLSSADLHFYEGFWAANGDRMAAFGGDGDGTELLLRNGADDVAAVEGAIRAMPGGADVAVEQRNDSLDAIADARQTVRFESVALVLFGVLSAIVGVVLVGQALSRQIRGELAQRHVLVGVGLTRRDLGTATLLRMAPVSVLGAAGGAAGAWASSHWTPIGFASRAEVGPGTHLDVAVVLPGAVLAALLVAGWSLWSGWRIPAAASATARVGFGGRLAASAARAGAPVAVVSGLAQLAGRTRGGGRTPLRSSLGAVSFAVAAVVAVAVFATSMDRFVDVPGEHGWSWDLIVGDSDDERLASDGPAMLAANDDVAGYASVWIGYEDFVRAGGGEVPVVGIETLAGDTYIALTEGARADADDEIVLGERTMEALGAEIGDEVTLDGVRDSATFRVVGTAVQHELVAGPFELDEGAVTTPEGLARLFASAEDITVGDTEFGGGTRLARFLVDAAPGASIADASASLKADFGPTVIRHLPPLDVAALDSTRRLPVAFGALVAVLGTASLVHLLLVTVRRRRHEFAVLAALGARRRQLAATVASLATALAVLALLVGVPAGLVFGRAGWTVLADALGAPTAPVVPLVALFAAVVVMVVTANVVAALPGRLAQRVRPAQLLRSE